MALTHWGSICYVVVYEEKNRKWVKHELQHKMEIGEWIAIDNELME